MMVASLEVGLVRVMVASMLSGWFRRWGCFVGISVGFIDGSIGLTVGCFVKAGVGLLKRWCFRWHKS